MRIGLLGLLMACSGGAQETGPVPSGDSADPPGGPGGDLVRAEAWGLGAGTDPFADHRTEDHVCDPAGVFVEEGLLEVRTALCGYAVLGQPSQVALAAGDEIELLLYHSALTAQTPAEAHVALTLDGALLWEQAVPIPSPSDVYSHTLVAPAHAAAGAPVVLHLHNHGSNAWNLGHLRAVAPAPAQSGDARSPPK